MTELSYDLPDIDDVKPYGPEDDACFAELREVLVKYNAVERFGITLLHQHFGMTATEVLVESIDKENRMLLSRP